MGPVLVSDTKPGLLIAESEDFSSRALDILQAKFEVELADLDRAGLLQSRPGIEVLWVRLRNQIDEEVMACFPNLKAVATNTTGLNHIDLEAAARLGIQVVSLKGETEFLKDIRATAEHTIGLTLALLRKIPQAVRHVQEGGWDRDQFRGSEIYQKTVGIIGYGRLGRIVAGYFEAFGAEVIVNSRDLEVGTEIDGKSVVSWEYLWRNADIISLHVNYEPENHEMIGAEEFALAKSSAVFINTARGELVDEDALVEALDRNIQGAAVDVIQFEQQTDHAKNSLVKRAKSFSSFLATPHVGGRTGESAHRTEEHIARMLQKIC